MWWKLHNAHRPFFDADTGGAGGGAGGDKAAVDAAAAAAAAAAAKTGDAAKLAADLAAAQARTTQLETDAATARAAAEAAQAALKKFEGIDVDQVKKLVQEKKDAETKALEAAGNWEALRARMAEEHAAEVARVRDEAKPLQAKVTTLEQQIHELTVGRSFSESTFITNDLVLTPTKARQVYGAHFELEGDKTVGYDKPAGAAARVKLIGGNGQPLPFDEAMKRIVEADPDKERLLRAKMQGGAGSKTNDTGASRSQEQVSSGGVSRIAAGLAGLRKR